jgi:hypothetical protein
MSVINCHNDEIIWGEILPGIYLVQAKDILNKEDPFIGDNGIEMHEGCFGLTISNDPSVIFSLQPMKEIKRPHTEWEKWYVVAEQWREELYGDIQQMGIIYNAAIKAGWNQKKHGFLAHWLCNRVAKYIEKRKPKDIYPSMYKMSNQYKIDQRRKILNDLNNNNI